MKQNHSGRELEFRPCSILRSCTFYSFFNKMGYFFFQQLRQNIHNFFLS